MDTPDALADLFDSCDVHCPYSSMAMLQEIMEKGRAVTAAPTTDDYQEWYDMAAEFFSTMRRKVVFDQACPVQIEISALVDTFLDDPSLSPGHFLSTGILICEKIYGLVEPTITSPGDLL